MLNAWRKPSGRPLQVLAGGLLVMYLAASSHASNTLADGFETAFREQVKSNGTPGAAFAIVSRDRVHRLMAVGHTDTSKTAPVNPDTVFRLASVSKTFAAGMVAILAEEGSLGWDEPVIRYVPGFRVQGDSSAIRIRDLMEHSTGIVPHAFDNLIEDGLDNQRILEKFAELPLLCQPGECYGYQNVLFSLVEPAAVQVSTLAWPDLVESRIFRPLGMRTASTGFDAFVSNPNHARPHVRSRGAWKTVAVKPNYYNISPAAGVNASISDLAKWLQAQLGARPEVVSREMVSSLTAPRHRTSREMYRSHWRDMLTDAHYGRGWRIYQLGDEQIVYHGGWVQGFRADLAYSPRRDLGIAILLNAETNSISELTTGFWKMAFAEPFTDAAASSDGPAAQERSNSSPASNPPSSASHK